MSAPKNSLQNKFRTLKNETNQPTNHDDRVGFGWVTDVRKSKAGYEVKIRLDNGRGDWAGGAWISLEQSTRTVIEKYGAIRKGLRIMLHYRGATQNPTRAVVRVIGDEESSFKKSKPMTNTVDKGPTLSLSGGLSTLPSPSLSKVNESSTSAERVRVWRTNSKAEAAIEMTDGQVVLAANSKNVLSVSEGGTVVTGPFAFGTTDENVRRGGFWAGIGDIPKMIPSTIVTPIPPTIPFPPLSFVIGILSTLPVILGLMSGLREGND